MLFEKYQHIERLNTVATEGILNGSCFIFPKLDGTNTSIYLDDNGEIEVASRNRVLTAVNDNRGVRQYVVNNPKFKAYLTKYPNRRLFAEWLVPHFIRDYLDDAWHRLYIFDVMQDGKYIPYFDYLQSLLAFKLDFIPMFDEIQNPTQKQLEDIRDNNGYRMKDGKIGEGIVIKRYDFVNKFGNTVWAKLVREKPDAPKKSILPAIDGESIEAKIIEEFLTPALIEKEFAKIAGGGWQSKLIGKFIQAVWFAFITEEIFNITQKLHNPTINFKLLQKFAVFKLKKVKSDVF